MVPATTRTSSETRSSVRVVAAVCAALLAAALVGCSGGGRETATTPVGPEPAPQVSGSVWVADETGNSLTVLDTATNTVATTLTGIQAPHNVQVGTDPGTVYATSADSSLVAAIDAESYKVIATARTGPHPAHVIDAPNGKVYVANSEDGTVSVFRRQNLEPMGRIEVGGMPHGLRAAADGSVIVVANHSAGALDVIDAGSDSVRFSVPVGDGPAQVAVSADGRFAYTGTTEPAAVVKVDLTARKIVGSAPVSAPPVQVFLTPDDATVVSADQGTPQAAGQNASVIDTATMTVEATVPTGAGPHGVVIDPTGRLAWVTDSYADTVSVIDLRSRTVTATVGVGAGPNGISYSPRPPSAGAPTVALDVPIPAEPAPAAGENEQVPGHHSEVPHQSGHG
ncbi:hypothetical protein CRI77_14385 [Mycolicibacterium duvalii]|uniref:Uncharacterized protein n=1 Tax=Mycolicibacterium duvalii TaxID=39688 RepID=A0A7I7K7R5_9MYCO|nr:hypothetical protein [Mycolicibacterium duvalii]MCV7366093.1 hypothetical protein [Mycolicibacterium duvalii]PEG40072.1 hypothetical protein CRI77_14385 [Mycolicibacterium duvalii]BBX19541.1 hypothetical protein MDUV_44010 [Mycolicibacterium duvalii]